MDEFPPRLVATRKHDLIVPSNAFATVSPNFIFTLSIIVDSLFLSSALSFSIFKNNPKQETSEIVTTQVFSDFSTTSKHENARRRAS